MMLKHMFLLYSGKVRDVFGIGEFNGSDALLIVSTDRISCFDSVLPTAIPGKGKIVNKMSNFWFEYFKDTVPNHIITSDLREIENIPDGMRENSVIVKKAQRLNVECVVRGYLCGSAWQDYKKTGEVCGIPLPLGLKESDKLDRPVFTPATKEETGCHDRNISLDEMKNIAPDGAAEKLRDLSILIYEKAARYAETRGIIIADTKLEFGTDNGDIILIDELLTPDSSRFWDANKYMPGRPQEPLDKQFVRDYVKSKGGAENTELPGDVVKITQDKYVEIYNRIARS
ncbi:MAG: phosphoribosylaminoimidazolesuccinocarboxamide synthase [Elusimicrobia bacterium]|nr:phosphoribosylaminoimidazolesuccinocarboxamide synthase [Elusimicrobiota bacterium]